MPFWDEATAMTETNEKKDKKNYSELAVGFGEALVEWTECTEAEAEVIRDAGRGLICAVEEGSVCLDRLPRQTIDLLIEKKLAVVQGAADPSVISPLVIDSRGDLFLRRYFEAECEVAQRLFELGTKDSGITSEKAAELAKSYFPNFDESSKDPDWQMTAVYLGLRKKLLVLSGGPGTGKTTTVLKILAAILEEDENNKIVMAAPTGKAAMRMKEAVSNGIAKGVPEKIRELAVPPAMTVHKLLHYPQIAYNRTHPLDYDTVIVDEASMLDLSLTRSLVDAIPENGRLILIGDKDQLASVEAGSVFAEISKQCPYSEKMLDELSAIHPNADLKSMAAASSTPLIDCVAWLRKSHRFGEDSDIGQFAFAVRDGKVDELNRLVDKAEEGLTKIDIRSTEGQYALKRSYFEELYEGYREYFDAVIAGDKTPEELLQIFDRYRILTAEHNGPFGERTINRYIIERFRREMRCSEELFEGKAIMMTANDPEVGVFNGDTGILLEQDGVMFAVFGSVDGIRRIPISFLEGYVDAFALTIHKSQGSEFNRVAIVLPYEASRILTRELFYTAVTRAKESVAIYGERKVMEKATKAPTHRAGALIERYREVLTMSDKAAAAAVTSG